MPADSAIKAIQDFYLTLDAAAFPNGVRPPIFFAEAPATRTGVSSPGTQLRPPYVMIQDGGEIPMLSKGGEPWAIGQCKAILEGPFSLDAYYKDLGEADACMKAILWNGQNPELKAGLAFCTLSMNLPLVSFPYNCIPMRTLRGYAGFAIDNDRVHKTHQEFIRRLYHDPQAT